MQRALEARQRCGEQGHHQGQPAAHPIAVGLQAQRLLLEGLRDGCGQRRAHGEDQQGKGVRVLPDEAETAEPVRMGHHQPKVQSGKVAQQERPDQMPPEPAEQEEPEQWTADDLAPPAGCRQDRRTVWFPGDEPGLALPLDDPADAEGRGTIGEEQTDGHRQPRPHAVDGPADGAAGVALRRGRHERRLDELAQIDPEACVDGSLHQDEDADGDDEPPPAPQSSRNGPVALGPSALPATSDRISGTPQASATASTPRRAADPAFRSSHSS